MVRIEPIGRYLVLSLFWGMMGSCAINDRKGPSLPGESKTSSSTDATVVVITDTQKTGRTLYDRNCEGCHNSFDKTTKRGVSTIDIMRAIARIPEMDSLDRLKMGEIQSISEALKK